MHFSPACVGMWLDEPVASETYTYLGLTVRGLVKVEFANQSAPSIDLWIGTICACLMGAHYCFPTIPLGMTSRTSLFPLPSFFWQTTLSFTELTLWAMCAHMPLIYLPHMIWWDFMSTMKLFTWDPPSPPGSRNPGVANRSLTLDYSCDWTQRRAVTQPLSSEFCCNQTTRASPRTPCSPYFGPLNTQKDRGRFSVRWPHP